MRKILLAAAAALAFIAPASAQQPVFSTQTGGTIATTNTFQTALAQPTQPGVRRGCMVQNLGANNMFVFFGDGTATVATSVKLTPSSTIRCDAGGVVIQDLIRITGTAADTFVVVSQ